MCPPCLPPPGGPTHVPLVTSDSQLVARMTDGPFPSRFIYLSSKSRGALFAATRHKRPLHARTCHDGHTDMPFHRDRLTYSSLFPITRERWGPDDWATECVRRFSNAYTVELPLLFFLPFPFPPPPVIIGPVRSIRSGLPRPDRKKLRSSGLDNPGCGWRRGQAPGRSLINYES